MSLNAENIIDKKLTELYADKITVCLDKTKFLNPDEVWQTMQIIASNNKALVKINFQ